MSSMTIAGALADFRTGRLTAEALVSLALEAASEHAALNAIAELRAEYALARARELDRQLAAGRVAGLLHGIPVTLKDLFHTDGFTMRAGTRAPLPALGRSTAVDRLLDAGAIMIATTNMHEVALGLTGENEWTGDVLNPHDPERQSGGSSSGSAVAVSVGIGLASLGTDLGGSIRVQPPTVGWSGSSRPMAWSHSTVPCRFPQPATMRDQLPGASRMQGCSPKCSAGASSHTGKWRRRGLAIRRLTSMGASRLQWNRRSKGCYKNSAPPEPRSHPSMCRTLILRLRSTPQSCVPKPGRCIGRLSPQRRKASPSRSDGRSIAALLHPDPNMPKL